MEFHEHTTIQQQQHGHPIHSSLCSQSVTKLSFAKLEGCQLAITLYRVYFSSEKEQTDNQDVIQKGYKNSNL